tara:strand:+ start:52 stop:285 length:234 start_codon:yes stop_codon:yes gene_type:complete
MGFFSYIFFIIGFIIEYIIAYPICIFGQFVAYIFTMGDRKVSFYIEDNGSSENLFFWLGFISILIIGSFIKVLIFKI